MLNGVELWDRGWLNYMNEGILMKPRRGEIFVAQFDVRIYEPRRGDTRCQISIVKYKNRDGDQ